jgi:hypothetical protein
MGELLLFPNRVVIAPMGRSYKRSLVARRKSRSS